MCSTFKHGIIVDLTFYDFHRSAYAVCKVFSIGRETNIRGATRAGKKMGQVLIISTRKGMTGIGRLIHHSETGELISGKLLGPIQATRYHITTRFWALTGSNMLLDVELIY